MSKHPAIQPTAPRLSFAYLDQLVALHRAAHPNPSPMVYLMPNARPCHNPKCKHPHGMHAQAGAVRRTIGKHGTSPVPLGVCTAPGCRCTKYLAQPTLGANHYEAMRAVYWGGDVLCQVCAKLLREVATTQPTWVEIGVLGGCYAPQAKLPYFGAMLLPAGRKALGHYLGTTPPKHVH